MNNPTRPHAFEYNPNNLLDAVLAYLHFKNDAQLSRHLGVTPPMISKIRHFKLPVSAHLLIRLHEATGWSIKELRALMGDNRERFYAAYLGRTSSVADAPTISGEARPSRNVVKIPVACSATGQEGRHGADRKIPSARRA